MTMGITLSSTFQSLLISLVRSWYLSTFFVPFYPLFCPRALQCSSGVSYCSLCLLLQCLVVDVSLCDRFGYSCPTVFWHFPCLSLIALLILPPFSFQRSIRFTHLKDSVQILFFISSSLIWSASSTPRYLQTPSFTFWITYASGVVILLLSFSLPCCILITAHLLIPNCMTMSSLNTRTICTSDSSYVSSGTLNPTHSLSVDVQ